jgi:hypothetical protein
MLSDAHIEPPAGRSRTAHARDPYLGIRRLTSATGFQPRFGVRHAGADYIRWLS